MFIDTNVLVNSRILEAPDHHIARSRLERAFRESEPLRISRQVVREYLSVVTRPQIWAVAIAREDALDDANRLISSFEILEDGPLVTESLIALCREAALWQQELPPPSTPDPDVAYADFATAGNETREAYLAGMPVGAGGG